MKIELDRHFLFKLVIYFKSLFALSEILVGILLFFSDTKILNKAITFLFQNELLEDPSDIFVNYLFNLSGQFIDDVKIFLSFYVLSHGIIKIIALVNLFRNKLWAYPMSIFVFALFVVYQLGRFMSTHSLFLVFLTIIDLIFIWLIRMEYKAVRKKIYT